jgi:hypothetical protein
MLELRVLVPRHEQHQRPVRNARFAGNAQVKALKFRRLGRSPRLIQTSANARRSFALGRYRPLKLRQLIR